MTPTFPWYMVVSGDEDLQQGDLIDSVPVLVTPVWIGSLVSEHDGVEVPTSLDVKYYDMIVVTQSCDLSRLGPDDEVIVCPRFDYLELVEKDRRLRDWKGLVNGRHFHAHVINECREPGHSFGYQVIDLRRMFSLQFGLVEQLARRQGDRVRMLPPYREHFAQAFARQFMRVGLPEDLPRESPSR